MGTTKLQQALISAVLSNRRQQYSLESKEYKEQLPSMLDMLISRMPMTVIDQPNFRCILSTYDPKFVLPSGKKVKKFLLEK